MEHGDVAEEEMPKKDDHQNFENGTNLVKKDLFDLEANADRNTRGHNAGQVYILSFWITSGHQYDSCINFYNGFSNLIAIGWI